MKKKTIILVFTVLFAVVMTACGGKSHTESVSEEVVVEILKEAIAEEVNIDENEVAVEQTIIKEPIEEVEKEENKVNTFAEHIYKAEDKIVEYSTYKTKWEEVTSVEDTFWFDYPSNWTVVRDDIGDYDTAAEIITLINERGIEIIYMNYGTLGGQGSHMYEADVTNVGTSKFVPSYPAECDVDYSYLGKFMVGKIKLTGELDMNTDSEYTPMDGGVFYAVMPESCKGKHADIMNLQQYFSFEYVANYLFMASSPDGKFTEEEEKEVIAILSSFRNNE